MFGRRAECTGRSRREWERQNYLKNRDRYHFNAVRHGAKKRGIEFTITFDEIVWPEFCPVFGVRLERKDGHHNDWSPSLDRIDNRKGYVPGNVIVVSMRANRIKWNATVVEL